MDRAIKDLDAVLHTIELDKLLNGPIEALIDYIDL